MKSDTRSFYETLVRRAALEVSSQLDAAVDLAALARGAALSPLHFHRIFRGMLGETPVELHRRLRMERAAHALAAGEQPVIRIALEAGYETHESFTRAFRERYAASPSGFRDAARASREGCSGAPRTSLPARSGLHFQPLPFETAPLWLKGDTTMNVDFKTMPSLRVGAVRHVGPYGRISEAFTRLGEIALPAGLLTRDAQMLGLYHDDPEATPAAELRSDAALTVSEGVPLPEGLAELRIPAGRYACSVHVGPYTGLGDAWAKFMGQWLPASGERLGPGPSFEIYRNNPMNTPAEQLTTELCVPLA